MHLKCQYVDGDLSTREYNLQFEREQFEVSLTLDVVDDIIAENDEIFIIYTSVIEDPEDQCASAVLLQDNDGEKINYATSTCNHNNPWWVLNFKRGA